MTNLSCQQRHFLHKHTIVTLDKCHFFIFACSICPIDSNIPAGFSCQHVQTLCNLHTPSLWIQLSLPSKVCHRKFFSPKDNLEYLMLKFNSKVKLSDCEDFFFFPLNKISFKSSAGFRNLFCLNKLGLYAASGWNTAEISHGKHCQFA